VRKFLLYKEQKISATKIYVYSPSSFILIDLKKIISQPILCFFNQTSW
jgi:hypothetical protein